MRPTHGTGNGRGGVAQVGVPCGQVNDIAQAFADPQLHHRDMFLTVDHPSSGELLLPEGWLARSLACLFCSPLIIY
jgi:crotonobetainyl-CoA:carnitine CoA-transferase CaiB-like acyl-CoA transferase